MQINVTEQTVEKFFKTGTELFKIPDYQRPYAWNSSQWEDFWEDITSLDAGSSHFLGSIVLISATHNPGANFNELEVVDGQQRLTTISVLLKVIHDAYVSANNRDAASRIKSYLYGDIVGGNERIKLIPGRTDRTSYEKLIQGKFNEIEGTTVHSAYQFFKERLNEVVDVDGLLRTLVYKLNFVIISTDSEKSAYRLFETLNDRGLELSAVDLIKNHLLKVVSEKRPETIDEVKNSWEDIIENLENIDKVRFFRQYLMSSKVVETRGKLTEEKLYDRFCEIVRDMADMAQFMGDIKKQSLLYSKLANCAVDKFNEAMNTEVNRSLENIAAIKATTSYTLLLRAFNELERAEDLLKLMGLIEVFAIRRSIVGTSTADIDNVYNALALDAFSGNDWFVKIKNFLEKNTPSDAEFREKFQTAGFQQNNQTRYILNKLEIDGYGAGAGGKVVGTSYSVHIEHIAPQSMNELSQWTGFGNLDSEQRKELITSIGNLTLLEKKPNIRASNSTFAEKKNYYAPNSQDPDKKTNFLMTHELQGYDAWGVAQIQERSRRLAELAVKIWNYNKPKI